MIQFKNAAKGARGIMLRASGMSYVESGATISVAESSVIAVAGGLVRVKSSPLDHDRDGRPGGVANTSPVTADEKRALLDAMDDAELREFVADLTGKKPHPAAKRETLIEKALG